MKMDVVQDVAVGSLIGLVRSFVNVHVTATLSKLYILHTICYFVTIKLSICNCKQ